MTDRITEIRRCPHCHGKLPVAVQAIPDGNDVPDSWRHTKRAAKEGWSYELPELLRATYAGIGGVSAGALFMFTNHMRIERVYRTKFAQHRVLGVLAIGIPVSLVGAAIAGVAYGATPALIQFGTRLYRSGFLASEAVFQDLGDVFRFVQQQRQLKGEQQTKHEPGKR